VSATVDVAAAYRHCEAVTRTRAGNFFYGICLLPAQRRRAMCAVYAFARRVDDIGDGTLAPPEKLRRLDSEARALSALAPSAAAQRAHAGVPDGPATSYGAATLGGEDPVMVALADALRWFPLPLAALDELIEGVRMDITGVSYERFEDLHVYCRRVAGAIGRLCLAIFGLRENPGVDAARAEQLADDLGVALQLTNILRDVREDALGARVYLPAEDLRRFGLIDADEAAQAGQPAAGVALAGLTRALASAADGVPDAAHAEQLEQLTSLVRFECERAREWFARGLVLTRMLDRRSAACVLAMAGIYRRLLERIDAHPEQALRRRTSLPAHEKGWVALRGMLPLRGRCGVGA